MLDTKLKNRHKLAVVLIITIIMLPAFIIMGQYRQFYTESTSQEELMKESYLCSTNFLEKFLKSSYALYNMENREKDDNEVQEEYPDVWEGFENIYPYMNYQVNDGNEEAVDKSLSDGDTELKLSQLGKYAFAAVLSFDKTGAADVSAVSGEFAESQRIQMKKMLSDSYAEKHSMYVSEYYADTLESPADRTYIFVMTQENLNAYLDEFYYTYAGTSDLANIESLLLILAVGLAALLLPMCQTLHTGDEKIFQVPFEVAVCVFTMAVSSIFNNMGWMLARQEGRAGTLDFLLWVVYFAAIYWSVSCFCQVRVLGLRSYVEKRILFIKLWKEAKKGWKSFSQWCGKRINKLYKSLDDIDFNDRNNKIIIKIVIANFVILLVLCSLWFFGIIGLIVYSGLLFFVLRKYFNDLKDKYAILLKATNEIAEGNLDVEIKEELGVFSPFKTEMERIQNGFKKAVNEEVKSQRMKTELITNVSHDLKTPLTAIITYVNLLKEEKDEEKRQAYIKVLDQKSLRLKSLIEDLFEISKATSENVTLDLVNVDIVNLFKQVKLELDDKIKEAGLEFRCVYPEDKMVLKLDSQKTYRIFENLVVNIVKYAMPHTRVYIEVAQEDEEAVVKMKNVSAAELNFNPSEITERFVRGDVSRNTEGSGLGLAIAKSFVELQNGRLNIETEADLYKVEIRWKL